MTLPLLPVTSPCYCAFPHYSMTLPLPPVTSPCYCALMQLQVTAEPSWLHCDVLPNSYFFPTTPTVPNNSETIQRFLLTPKIPKGSRKSRGIQKDLTCSEHTPAHSSVLRGATVCFGLIWGIRKLRELSGNPKNSIYFPPPRRLGTEYFPMVKDLPDERRLARPAADSQKNKSKQP